jgi:multiple sugar transport system substrate-binding protein
MLDGNYFWQQALDNAEPQVKDHLGMAAAPFPTQAGSVSNSLHISAGLDPDTRAAVCDFIALAASEKYQQKYGEAISVPPPRDGAITDALRARFPEQIALMIASKGDAVSILPEAQAALENYGLFSKMVADALIELLATDQPTEQILANLQSNLESELPLD